MSICRRHFQRVSAAQAAAATDAGAPINASAYELVLAQLAEDRRRLKAVQSIERKIEIKRQRLPQYLPWIEGVLEGGRGGQDAVLMTVMVWCIDTGEFEIALRIAAYAIQHDLAMPDQYRRDVATLVAEEIADVALAAFSAGGTFSDRVLATAEALTQDRDMPDEVRAKVHKALGLALAARLEGDDRPAALASRALEHLRRALSLHERVGVKKDIERLERFIKNHPGTDAADADASGVGRDTPPATAAEASAG
ncbi:MAG: phage terminase small subunit [Lysobacter sp.]